MLCKAIKQFKSFLSKNTGKGKGAHTVEKKISQLEERIQRLEQYYNQDQNSPLIIEQLYIETLTVDKMELNNNINTLGIRELSGMLSIGANYGGGSSLPNREQGQKPPPSHRKDEKKSTGEKGPKCNIDYMKTKRR